MKITAITPTGHDVRSAAPTFDGPTCSDAVRLT